MMITNTVQIEAPVECVWELTVDLAAWPEITPTMTSVERLDAGSLKVGSRALVKQPGQRPRVWTVTRLVPGEIFAWSAPFLGTTMTATHQLAPTASGTRNTLTVDIVGRCAPIVGGLLRRPVRRAITTENEGFKNAAESRSA